MRGRMRPPQMRVHQTKDIDREDEEMAAEDPEMNRRLPLLEPASLNREQRDVYDSMAESMLPWAKASGFAAETADGRLLGPFNAFLYSPELGAVSLRYLATERESTELDARVREVVILTVGAIFRSEYEVYAHRAVAAEAGLKSEDIEALAGGQEPKTLAANELIAHRFIRALAADHRVPPALFDEAKAAFGHKGLVDMIHLAGVYMTVSALLNAFEVPVP